MSSWLTDHLWFIPAIPLAASLVILSLSNSRRTASASLAVIGQCLTCVLSIVAFLSTLGTPGYRVVQNFTWFTFGEQAVHLGWMLDPLAAVMLIMISLVGLCIFVFSIGYMSTDRNFTRFFAYLSFFSAAMLGLVIANSLLLLFICWELVGLASYLLIGFWIERRSAAAAAKKAFITTRIGDIGFFLGLVWIYGCTGTTLFYDHGRGCLENIALAIGGASTFIALLIFCGAVGKSGQFPLHVWLPDAMEGPTPVSALIHAATMVAAGVFLVARVYPLFSARAENGTTHALSVVISTGVITALMASLIALAQFDIKRILAYSTVSQLGLMMVALGVGGVAAGIMHLIVHGFFKALLFLGAGSVIHSLDHEQDIRQMGGLRSVIPVTFLTYTVGMMNLSGVPLLFSGGWTKEEILHATAHWPVSHWPYYLMLIGVVLTALYMTRQMIYVFFGRFQSSGPALHESPPAMTMPLILLATCSILLALVLTPAWPWLRSYLNGETPRFNLTLLFAPMLLLSLLLVGAGIGLGIAIYRPARLKDPLDQVLPALFRFLENKMGIDDLYERTVVTFSRMAARLADLIDRYFWDGLVGAFAAIGNLFGNFTANFDERGINAGVDQTTAGTRDVGRMVAGWHSGRVQTYLGVAAVGMLALLILYAWLA